MNKEFGVGSFERMGEKNLRTGISLEKEGKKVGGRGGEGGNRKAQLAR